MQLINDTMQSIHNISNSIMHQFIAFSHSNTMYKDLKLIRKLYLKTAVFRTITILLEIIISRHHKRFYIFIFNSNIKINSIVSLRRYE